MDIGPAASATAATVLLGFERGSKREGKGREGKGREKFGRGMGGVKKKVWVFGIFGFGIFVIFGFGDFGIFGFLGFWDFGLRKK